MQRREADQVSEDLADLAQGLRADVADRFGQALDGDRPHVLSTTTSDRYPPRLEVRGTTWTTLGP